jgi:hypothetical protein
MSAKQQTEKVFFVYQARIKEKLLFPTRSLDCAIFRRIENSVIAKECKT